MLSCKYINLRIAREDASTRTLIENLNFEARPCEILMLVGKNGTGKSTLLRTLMGLNSASSGTVSLYGENLKVSQSESAKHCAYVVQDSERGTLGDLTVMENLCFALAKGKIPSIFRFANSKLNQDKVHALLSNYAPKFLALVDQKVSSLSGGQRQLLSILMSLASEAKVLLLDEPTAALDEATAEEVMTQIRRWVVERELISIMVCHDSSLVQKYGDRVLDLGMQ